MRTVDQVGAGNKGKSKRIPESALLKKFWSNVLKTDRCWLWIGRKNKNYGQFYMFGKNEQAHRAAWKLTIGEIPHNLVVMHKCDNPLCVNPNHLSIGTQRDNIIDMLSKGRGGINFKSKISNIGKIAAIDAYVNGHKKISIARYFKVHPIAITRLLSKNGFKPREYKRSFI